MTTDCEKWAAMLVQAEDALFNYRLGSRVESVSHADKSVRYSPNTEATLVREIARLKGLVAGCGGPAYSPRRVVRVLPV